MGCDPRILEIISQLPKPVSYKVHQTILEEIFAWERLSTSLKVTLVPNPRYFKRMWFLRNAEQTLLTTKQYRSFAISGFSSQFLRLPWNNVFLLSSCHIIIRTNSLFYTRLKKTRLESGSKSPSGSKTRAPQPEVRQASYAHRFSGPILESTSFNMVINRLECALRKYVDNMYLTLEARSLNFTSWILEYAKLVS